MEMIAMFAAGLFTMFAAGSPSLVLTVLFWVLLFLALIAAFVPDANSPYIGRGRWIIVLVLVAILGWACLGIK